MNREDVKLHLFFLQMSSKIEQEKQVKLLKIGFKEKKRKQFTQSLDDAAADKLPKYCADYNFNPPRGAGFMPIRSWILPLSQSHTHPSHFKF
jgi:hypothetical protein